MSDLFSDQMHAYTQAINADIAAYAAHARVAARSQYGEAAGDITDAFLALLEAKAKRMRGTLVIIGYEMLGGQDQSMILRAATALEMLHTHLLVIDDIQDRSVARRGQLSLHTVLTGSPSLARGDAHTGTMLALNAALAGSHAAQMLLGGLNVEPELSRNALGIISHTMVLTGHGQTYDLLFEHAGDVLPTEAELDQVLHWKTAEYTFLNPLCVGMVLAGAGCEDTNAIREYALHAGKAFQLTNDIKGIFGTEAENGKDIREDVQEGKRTYLTVYALHHAPTADKLFLAEMLGNQVMTEVDFARCRTIIETSGALKHAENLRDGHIAQALEALEGVSRPWNATHVHFLRELVKSL